MTTDWIEDAYRRIFRSGIKQWELAKMLGMDNGYLNHILRRRRAAPKGFREKFQKALVDLEQASSAAVAAKNAVLVSKGYEALPSPTADAT